MALHWSHESPGKHGAGGEGFSVRPSRTSSRILEQNPEDNFECTYFRQRTNRNQSAAKKTVCYASPSDFSDIYTDSDSESDNTSNVERWLESLPTNDAWSSAPNYSALDGSEGLEGIDEIQEDRNKCLENGTEDSQKCFFSETDDSMVRMTDGDPSKRKFDGPNELLGMGELMAQQRSNPKTKRTLKTRKKIPLWAKDEREASRTTAAMKYLSFSEKTTLLNNASFYGSNGYDYKLMWKNEKVSGETEMKRSTFDVDGYDEMMRDINRLLTVSPSSKDLQTLTPKIDDERDTQLHSTVDIVDSKTLRADNESENAVDSDSLPLHPVTKIMRSSTTFKMLSPKLAKTRITDNQQRKRKRMVQKTTKKNQNQNPKRMRKVSQIRQPLVVKQQLQSIPKNRYTFSQRSIVKRGLSGREADLLKPPRLPRMVRFQDEVTLATPVEAWREAATMKAARNKEILHTVEQIVDDIRNDGMISVDENIGEGQGRMSSIPGCQLVDRSKRKRPMISIENKGIESKRPIFTNSLIENCLDKAMEAALNKYKRSQNTWESLVKKKSSTNASGASYEPPVKTRKPKSLSSKLDDSSRQELFSRNSWQSIHKYFLLHSSCK